MKVLITGSSGALGRILTEYLISRNISVAGLDIKAPEEHYEDDRFRFHRCCITDKERLEEIFASEQPSHVVHFACSFNKIRNRRLEYEIDVVGSSNVLEIAEKTFSVRQLIYSSSAAIYGAHSDNKGLLSESDKLRPERYRYGINKKLVENNYFKTPVRQDLHIVSLRICTVVGPSFDKSKSVVSLLIKFPYLPKFCQKNKMQFLHSDDFVSLLGHVFEDSDISGIYNLAPNDFVIISDLVPMKRFIRLPLSMLKFIIYILWNLRLLNLQPASVKASVYPILLNPARIMERYGYRFKFSSEKAFINTLHINKLPADSKF